MTNLAKLLVATAAGAAIAVPAAAQTAYPYPYQQQPYQQQPYPQAYPPQYPGYQYQQGYGANPVQTIIDQLLGNRYNVSDRRAVSQCAAAATAQAQNQYRGYGYQQGYPQQGYGYNQGFAAPSMRVTAITSVERRNNGLRVRGLMSSGYAGGYGNQYAYPNQGYAAGDISFRCNVDYRGVVTNVRISNTDNRRY